MQIFYWRSPSGSGPTPPPPVFHGYVTPSSMTPLPGSLTLTQFIQTVLVGLSGLNGTLVRPKWQAQPPKQPDLSVNWLAYAVTFIRPDANAFVWSNADELMQNQRQEEIEVQCSFYGPDAFDYAGIVRDGFQIQQNLEGLRAANMGFASTGIASRIPDLVNERWINRVEMSIVLRRQVQRVYPITTLVSANGTIHTVLGNEEYLLNWQAPPEES